MSNILIISDSHPQNNRMKSLLEEEGFHVQTACGGLEGVQLLDENYFDLLITEILMPQMNGFEIISHIRATGKTMKIIAMTSGGIIGVDAYLKAVRSFGADMVMKIPFRDGHMIRVVRSVLKAYDKDQQSA